jgi:hypothetical protein
MSAAARLEVAGLSLSLASREPLDRIAFGAPYRPFLAAAPTVGAPDLALSLVWAPVCAAAGERGEPLFDSGGLWSLRRDGGELVFVLRSPERGGAPYRIAAIDEELGSGEILSDPGGRTGGGTAPLPDPFEYPLGELLLVQLLARRGGLLVHGCGVDDGGRGLLFAGESGDGKSTMARLWEGAGRVLNDDRVALRVRGSAVEMYGTPWHGDHPEVGPGGVTLSRIFVLSRAAQHRTAPLGPAEAASLLLARSFPPLWSGDGVARALAALEEIAALAPCARLGFAPTPDVVPFVRSLDWRLRGGRGP